MTESPLDRSVGIFPGDPTAWVRATGPDFLGLLHRLSTKNVQKVLPGEGAETVVTSAKGRIVTRAWLSQLPDGSEVWSHVGEGISDAFQAHLKRYTFAEQLGLEPFEFAVVHAIGPAIPEWCAALGLSNPDPLHVIEGPDGLFLIGHDTFGREGVSLVSTQGSQEALLTKAEATATDLAGRLVTPEEIECYRISKRLPKAGHELTEDFNPLEMGLTEAVDFDKGCYVGQEVVARLHSYDKVTKHLYKFKSASKDLTAGVALSTENRKAGVITSVCTVHVSHDEDTSPQASIGLAVLKKKLAADQKQFRVEGSNHVVELID